jgi:glycosyltransferase involved in cell wall biosynthesis
MRIIFWQNIISPHQLDFLKALSYHYDITLIVEQVQDSYRAEDGWEVPEYDFLKVVVKPSLDSLDEYFEDSNIIHVFSGISGYKLVYKGFKKAVKYNAKIGVFSEPVNLRGFKGFLKLLRGNYQRLKYGEKIGFIAATGDLGIQTYLKFGYNKELLFQWGYFVDPIKNKDIIKENSVIFVGNLNNNKQVEPLVDLFLNSNFNYDKLHVLGNGPLEQNISNKIGVNDKITLHGRLSNKETLSLISKCKLLILPSLHDGWGVVVNEALLSGTPVITSDEVGAKILIKNSYRGDIFKAGDMSQLKTLIVKWSKKEYLNKDYAHIQRWAFDNISPTIAANYFSKILEYVFEQKTNIDKPLAPWLKNENR